ncbi:Metallo-dependent phosphatase-like protein [Rhodocollybia butyracea]|uniref:Metallo-dependent phosphatase-like protein n=1 Tax=Rhodocollybia butyracea TaxID=206335 RepID=A0A9P5PH47_9AGAR|nr:Metallo-dependent phosphatase-like protein [Rhodocollybia butyracea]
MQSPSSALPRMLIYFALSGFILYLLLADVQKSQSRLFGPDDVNRRVLIVGDIHGKFLEFQNLLGKVNYNPSYDVLVSVGDIVSKGPHSGSMRVLQFMASHNITAVRGNQDQKVIEWRSWLEYIHSLPGGTRWLYDAHTRWDKARKDGTNVDKWLEEQFKNDKKYSKWWKRIPDGWQLFGDHYQIAEQMTSFEYAYLIQRPLKIHIPHAHTFVVHAGVLASDPNYKPGHKRQPLAHVPTLPKLETESQQEETSALRRLQEVAILKDVPQNLKPWNTLNMRGILKDNTVTRGKDGTPWAELYNNDMQRCDGFEPEKPDAFPCHPSTVIYGHSASRGLDIRRWTMGIDTGCVYGRKLTALVIGGQSDQLSETEEEDIDYDGEAIDVDGNLLSSKVKFGDDGYGKIQSVPCT